jgi:hypothetical protein
MTTNTAPDVTGVLFGRSLPPVGTKAKTIFGFMASGLLF